MSRGDETHQSSLDADIFTGDEPFYALKKVEPLVEIIIEADKRFGVWAIDRNTDIGKKEDEIKALIDDIKDKFRYWEDNNKEDSPAFHLILDMVKTTVEALESYKKVAVNDIKFLTEFRLYAGTLVGAANGIQAHVAKQDARVGFLEEKSKLGNSLEEVGLVIPR